MGKVVWKRRDEIKNAIKTIPAFVKGSTKNFRPPPTLDSDFDRLLGHDVPHINYTFELVKDWYAVDSERYEPVYIRAQQTPIDWKSKIGNSDMSTNFKVTHSLSIHKGDMVVREDGALFLLNWNIQNHANNQATQSIECNTTLSFTRDKPEVTDEDGYLIEESGREIIAPPIPCVHVEYAGRPDYAATQGTPGIHADHLISVYLQWNPKTKNIRINDEFEIGSFTYRVINISIAEVHIDQGFGILTLHAKRVAGGGILE